MHSATLCRSIADRGMSTRADQSSGVQADPGGAPRGMSGGLLGVRPRVWHMVTMDAVRFA